MLHFCPGDIDDVSLHLGVCRVEESLKGVAPGRDVPFTYGRRANRWSAGCTEAQRRRVRRS